MLIEAKISGLALDPKSQTPMVVLESPKGKLLSIWIGVFEASAIALAMEKVQVPRPMTHDLAKNVVEVLGSTVLRAEVVDLRDGTYYARLVLLNSVRQEIQIDARPSDAIAVALRFSAKILVEEALFDSAQEPKASEPLALIDDKGLTEEERKKKLEELLRNLSDDAFGKYKM